MKRYAAYLLLPMLVAGCTQVSKQSIAPPSATQAAIPADASLVTGTTIVKGHQPYSSANFSADGTQLVYLSRDQSGPAIYTINQSHGQWAVPDLAVSLHSSIVELPDARFSHFITAVNDQPSIAAGRVAFLAQLTSGATGLFYAQKVEGVWQVHRAVTTDNRVHVGGNDYFTAFSGPKILANAIYFIADAGEKQYLYRYDLATGLRTAIPAATAAGQPLENLRNLSFSGNSFALTADVDGKAGVYAFEGYGSFRRLSPEHYNNVSGDSIAVKLGQMSYGRFGTQMGMITTANKQLSEQALIPQTGVYINIQGFNEKPALLTWQKVSGLEFLHFKAPLLLKASRTQASFVFVANTAKAPQQMGVYQANIANGVVGVKPLLIPGEYLDQQRVEAVNIGDYSATRGQLAVSVRFANGQEGVYLLATS